MKKNRLTVRLILEILTVTIALILGYLLLLIFHPYRAEFVVRSQSGCPPLDAAVKGWPKGSTVYYDFGNLDSEQRRQAKSAFDKWTSANSLNGSNVTFAPADSTHPANLHFQAQTGGNMPGSSSISTEAGVVAQATVTFNSPNITYFNFSQPGYDTAFEKVALHEIGHTMGLDHPPVDLSQPCGGQAAGASVMNEQCNVNDKNNNSPTNVTSCDNQTVTSNPQYQAGSGGGGVDPTCDCSDIIGCLECSSGAFGCFCSQFNPQSPIIVDVNRDGYDLTDLWGGVKFDLDVKGRAGRTAWTTAGSDDAFLALDRNGNGMIDDGSELFGNNSKLADGATADNGWDALAVFDRVERGSNEDGLIDYHDAVYGSLRLWQDVNHNGISEPNELFTLSELGVDTLSLDYQVEGRRDRNGNFFRFRSRVFGHDVVMGNTYKSFAFDVFFGIPKRLDR